MNQNCNKPFEEKKIQSEYYVSGKKLIEAFSDFEYDFAKKVEEKKTDNKDLVWGIKIFKLDKKLSLNQVFIDLYQTQESLSFKKVDPDDINLSSFFSNLVFIEKLCQICENLRNTPNENQLGLLQSEMMKLNKSLPSNVYVPFLNENIRNYVVVHVPVTEPKIFRTKTRAPYMITIELIRIDELIL